MLRYGYGLALALSLSLIFASTGKQNDSTLQLRPYSHTILNGSSSSSNIWSEKDLEVTVTVNDRHKAQLAHSSIIYGLAEVANASNVNAICYAQLKQVQRGILNKQPWAMKGDHYYFNMADLFIFDCLRSLRAYLSFCSARCLWRQVFGFCFWPKLLAGQSGGLQQRPATDGHYVIQEL